MDVLSLVPLEVFYLKTGVNSLLRFPRLLKVTILRQPLIIMLNIPCFTTLTL